MRDDCNACRNGALPANGGDELRRLAELAGQFGDDNLAADARALAERVAEGRFYVACVGQFKRGKSSLLNAIIGEALLPADIIPVTTVPTVVRYGACRTARVQQANGSWTPVPPEEIQQYVSEAHNPENAKRVTGVEVFVPASLLAGGMCFVDTPGLGSVFAGNAAATHAFIPHIDAAIVVIGADPPISGDELCLVETVAAHIRDLLFVLNKADRVSERERQAAAAFACKMLEARLRRPIDKIYEISAAEWLEKGGPERDWPQLIRDLAQLAAQSGRSLTARARDRGLRRIGDLLLRVIHEERRALLQPVEESERRVASLRLMIADAERSMTDLAHLFIAEQHRLSRQFADRRKDFLKACAGAHHELVQALCTMRRRNGPRLRRDAMRAAQEIAKRRLMPWLSAEQAFAEQAFCQAVQRFVDMGNNFLGRLAEARIPELAETPRPLDAEPGFRTRSRFHFHDFIEVARPASPMRFTADLLSGLLGVRGRIERDAHDFLDHLLETNAVRVQSDVDKRVSDGKSRLETDIRILLHDISGVAERALSHARSAQVAGAPAVEAALARLSSAEQEIRQLRPAEDAPPA